MGFTVLAGEGLHIGKHEDHVVMMGALTLRKDKGSSTFFNKRHTYQINNDVVKVETVDEEAYRSGLATAGWGLVGLALAGPLGVACGSYFGGKTDNVIAAVELIDGRKFLAQLKRKQYRKLTEHLAATQRLESFEKF